MYEAQASEGQAALLAHQEECLECRAHFDISDDPSPCPEWGRLYGVWHAAAREARRRAREVDGRCPHCGSGGDAEARGYCCVPRARAYRADRGHDA